MFPVCLCNHCVQPLWSVKCFSRQDSLFSRARSCNADSEETVICMDFTHKIVINVHTVSIMIRIHEASDKPDLYPVSKTMARWPSKPQGLCITRCRRHLQAMPAQTQQTTAVVCITMQHWGSCVGLRWPWGHHQPATTGSWWCTPIDISACVVSLVQLINHMSRNLHVFLYVLCSCAH